MRQVFRAHLGRRRPVTGLAGRLALGAPVLATLALLLVLLAPSPGPAHGPTGTRSSCAPSACLAPAERPAGAAPQNLSWVHLRHPSVVLPSARTGAAMASDPSDGGVLLFGGCGPSQCPMNDTWWYSDGSWTNLTPSLSVSPPGRYGAAAAFDPSSRSVLLFGGCAGRTPLSDAWSFSDGAWTLVPAQSPWPSARCNATATTDAASDGVAIYGGLSPTGSPLSDLWLFQNGTFSELAGPGSQGPGYRLGASLTFDGAAGALLLFGGANGAGAFDSDAWYFTHNVWVPATAVGGLPTARANATFAYDPTIGGDLLFGGQGADGILGDTWLYEDASWTNVSALMLHPPAPHAETASAYDDADGYLLLEGGITPGGGIRNDTWALVRPLTASIGQPYGAIEPDENVRLLSNVAGGVPPYRYNWTFGDGTPPLHLAAPSHSFSAPGVYGVHLTVTDFRNVVAWSNLSVIVGAPPVSVLLSVTPSVAMAGSSVSIVANPSGGELPYSYHWSGLPAGCSAAPTPAITCHPNSPGTFAIGVIVTDARHTNASAGATLSVTVVAPVLGTAAQPSSLASFDRFGWLLVPPLAAAVAWSAYASFVSYRSTRNLPPLPPPPKRPECYVPPEWSETPPDYPIAGAPALRPPRS